MPLGVFHKLSLSSLFKVIIKMLLKAIRANQSGFWSVHVATSHAMTHAVRQVFVVLSLKLS